MAPFVGGAASSAPAWWKPGGKTVIGTRCKQAGLFWSEPGTEHILALRCLHHSRRLQDFWVHRLNAHAPATIHSPSTPDVKHSVPRPL